MSKWIRAVVAGVLAAVVMIVLAVARGGSEPTETVTLPSSTTETTSRWGEPLGSTPTTSDDGPGAAAGTGPDGGAASTTTGRTSVDEAQDEAQAEAEAAASEIAEETEGDPGLSGGDPAPGEFPMSSNASEDYPLEAMVDPAVALLRAEITGEGSDAYPHLAGRQEGPCCTDLVVNGAVVLFGETTDDPARIMLDWEAIEVEGGGTRQAVTETRWWWTEGAWVPEHAR